MRGRIAVAAAAVAAALAAPAAAFAATTQVTLADSAFSPALVSVLPGDTVTWRNSSLREHTVSARDGSFGSPGHIRLSGGYSFQFSKLGSHPYVCLVHPFMSGEVGVYPLLLTAPRGAVSRGSRLSLDGRAAADTSSVQIQRDSGAGFAAVAAAAVDGGGGFHASLPAGTTARYRAVSAAGMSPAVQVVVVDRKLVVAASRPRHGRRKVLVRVRAAPREPGALVVLQLNLRERFGWFPVARRRLDKHSRAVFRAPRGARARVVLTLPDGWTPVTTSVSLRLPR